MMTRDEAQTMFELGGEVQKNDHPPFIEKYFELPALESNAPSKEDLFSAKGFQIDATQEVLKKLNGIK
eukprot:81955-Hanusia_phi.AAC.2